MDRIKIKKHLGLALSLFQPCDPVPVSPTGWSLPEMGAWPTQSKGQGTDAERIRETGAKKKKKKKKQKIHQFKSLCLFTRAAWRLI